MTPISSLLCVTGLPRAGSTLLCQLLDMHPDIHSEGHSSPLLHCLTELRYQISDDPFLLSQLDINFERSYARLKSAYRGFMHGWFAEATQPWLVDKNRDWLNQLDLLLTLNPSARLIVCVRDLGQVIGSIEAQHQQTVLLDFPNHLANLSSYDRTDALLAKEGLVGGPLRSIEAMQDQLSSTQNLVYYMVFEDLIREPDAVMQSIFKWLGVDSIPINTTALPTKPHESDSHYRFKYCHKTHSQISSLRQHHLPPRISEELLRSFNWFYQTFYPAKLKAVSHLQNTKLPRD